MSNSGAPQRVRSGGSGDQLRSFRRRNLKDDLASYIRELVFSAELRPGMRVDQDAIARVFGTSKLPVREALIVLESEGLMVNYPNRGSFVADLTPDDFRDSYLVVGQVSAIAARRAATRITDEQLTCMGELLGRMESADFEVTDASHHEFHRLVNLAGGSRRLNRVLRMLSNAIPERLHYAARIPGEELIAEHRVLLKALEDRDPDLAAGATLAHFTNGARHAVDFLSDRGFWDVGALASP